ncbi:GNAT family N-acetyltransferase [Tistrella bauzanensis]|jgi:phosphinothricin acetyltransferase|uniref:N-acetyltransferase family protein n=1 Tax=Tistrella arctica TaxID=3133430 RepID=A0ABU9YM35_9PROT
MTMEMARQLAVRAIRPAETGDLAAIATIYGHHVLTGRASFEEQPPTAGEMRARHAAITGAGYPYLVCTIDGAVAGYAYASLYRARPAYRYVVEDSVYIAPGLEGQGIGRALLAALIDHCAAGPWRQMIAVIGDSGNAGSIGLHAALGFEMIGTFRSIGFKFGGWVDSVLMQRPIGPGDMTLP